MKHWYKLWQTQDLIVQKPCDGQWVLLCEAQHLVGECKRWSLASMEIAVFSSEELSAHTAWGMGLEASLTPPLCTAPRRHPQTRGSHWQDWATTRSDTRWDNCNAAQGTVHQRYFLHCGAWVRFFYATSWRADLFVSGTCCGAELFFWALTYLMHPNKWRMLVWKFAATLR